MLASSPEIWGPSALLDGSTISGWGYVTAIIVSIRERRSAEQQPLQGLMISTNLSRDTFATQSPKNDADNR